MSRLDDIKDRLEGASLPELEVRVTPNLRWADVIDPAESDAANRIARCADDEHAILFSHAPSDLAALVAVVEGVQRIAETMRRDEGRWAFPEVRFSNELAEVLRPLTEEGQK